MSYPLLKNNDNLYLHSMLPVFAWEVPLWACKPVILSVVAGLFTSMWAVILSLKHKLQMLSIADPNLYSQHHYRMLEWQLVNKQTLRVIIKEIRSGDLKLNCSVFGDILIPVCLWFVFTKGYQPRQTAWRQIQRSSLSRPPHQFASAPTCPALPPRFSSSSN